MKVLSLFDGICTGRFVLEKLGIKIDKFYSSEIDKYASSITRYNFPDNIELGDVTKIDFSTLQGIDLLIGGSPCQDLSSAKHGREGLKGSKSSLFYYYLEALDKVRPKYFMLENVASMRNSDKDIMTSLLKEIYPDTEVYMIDGALVSAQSRRRYWWTNIPNVTIPEDRNILLKSILQPIEEIGDVYNISEKLTKSLMTPSGKTKSFVVKPLYPEISKKAGCLTARYWKMGRTDPYIVVSDGSVKITDDTLKSQNNRTIELNNCCEPYMFKETRTEEGKLARKQAREKGLGDTTPRNPNSKKFIPKTEHKANCLTTTTNFEHVVAIPDDNMLVLRKLTPIECERLMTLPDNFTAFGIDENGKTVPISNTRRYQTCGNGWVADVVEHIFKNLVDEFK